MSKKLKDRFDLETDIMQCWNIVDDIDLLYENVCDNSKFDMPPETNDRIANALLGLKELYEMRFERLNDTFAQTYRLDKYREVEDEDSDSDWEENDWQWDNDDDEPTTVLVDDHIDLVTVPLQYELPMDWASDANYNFNVTDSADADLTMGGTVTITTDEKVGGLKDLLSGTVTITTDEPSASR